MHHQQSSLFTGMRGQYIHDGRILRPGLRRGADFVSDQDYNLTIRQQLQMILRHFSMRRFLIVAIPVLLLITTNPTNEILPQKLFDSIQLQHNSKSSSSSSSSINFFDKASRWLMPPAGTTNYGLFSLEDRFDGITVLGLGQQSLWSCPFNSPELGPLCEFLADNMCHHKPFVFDKQDKSYTVHRVLCFLLILSSFLDYCCGPWAPPLRLFWNFPTLDAMIGTVFYRPLLLHDLFCQNIAVYPALQEMQSIITTRLSSPTTKFMTYQFPMAGPCVGLNYILFVLLLVLLVAGGSNAVAAKVGRQDPFTIRGGYATVIAGSLGFCMHETVYRNTFWFTKNKVLLSVWGNDVTAPRAFWTSAVWIVLNGQQTTHSSREWFPQLVAWLLAGFGGLLLAKYPLQ